MKNWFQENLIILITEYICILHKKTLCDFIFKWNEMAL